jgi:RNA polymerase sigma factor (TIGR02999 family)
MIAAALANTPPWRNFRRSTLPCEGLFFCVMRLLIQEADLQNKSGVIMPHQMNAPANDITGLLQGWRQGDRSALDRLIPLINRELNRIAKRQLGREQNAHSLEPASLIQEAFLRLLGGGEVDWQNRAHFFAVASEVMRHVLVDYARARRRLKRGGATVHVRVDAAVALSPDQVDQIVAVDLALRRLAEIDERKSRVLEMRFFGGLDVEETAEALGVSTNTVIRDWNFARAWLRRELGGKGSSDCRGGL